MQHAIVNKHFIKFVASSAERKDTVMSGEVDRQAKYAGRRMGPQGVHARSIFCARLACPICPSHQGWLLNVLLHHPGAGGWLCVKEGQQGLEVAKHLDAVAWV